MDYVWYITPEQYEKAAKNGIDEKTLNGRVRRHGWDIDRAMTQPKQKRAYQIPEELVKKAAENGIQRKTLYSRIRRYGMDPETATTRPVMSREEKINNIRKHDPELVALAIKTGMSYDTFRKRVAKGMDPVKAATIPPMTRSEAGRIKKKRSG